MKLDINFISRICSFGPFHHETFPANKKTANAQCMNINGNSLSRRTCNLCTHKTHTNNANWESPWAVHNQMQTTSARPYFWFLLLCYSCYYDMTEHHCRVLVSHHHELPNGSNHTIAAIAKQQQQQQKREQQRRQRPAMSEMNVI